MKAVFYTGRFRKDFKLAIKRGLNMSLIQIIMKDLENEIPLEPEQITFVRTGTHADLF